MWNVKLSLFSISALSQLDCQGLAPICCHNRREPLDVLAHSLLRLSIWVEWQWHHVSLTCSLRHVVTSQQRRQTSVSWWLYIEPRLQWIIHLWLSLVDMSNYAQHPECHSVLPPLFTPRHCPGIWHEVPYFLVSAWSQSVQETLWQGHFNILGHSRCNQIAGYKILITLYT
jgi:hypothetical protein